MFSLFISRSTRITENTATLIDLVFTNTIHSVLSSNIFTLVLFDHLATHTKILLNSSTTPASHRFSATEIFLIKSTGYLLIPTIKSPKCLFAQESYNKFEEISLKHYDAAYPLKSSPKRRKNERKNPKPWILSWPENTCARKDRLFHVFVKDPSIEKQTSCNRLKIFL